LSVQLDHIVPGIQAGTFFLVEALAIFKYVTVISLYFAKPGQNATVINSLKEKQI
jgi:hypothetical protein